MSDTAHPSVPPEAWLPARRLADAVRRPIEQFLHIEAASGIILLLMAAVALLWANSAWHDAYEHLWETPFAIQVGDFTFSHNLHFWINEVLMTVFFLVVGLEIKREMVEGALADVKRAALPVAAAVGGMLAPALIYLALNPGPTRHGWGVPMATDIAFAVGVLTLLGKRVPPPMRVLLLALAIIDDIGAIVVIALFYSTGFSVDGILIVLGGVLLLAILSRAGVRPGWSSVAPLAVIWIGLYRTGVHPTLAGVIVGLGTSARSWLGREGFLDVAKGAVDEFEDRHGRGAHDHELIAPLDRLAFARREALSPAMRVQHTLHPWVAYLIMPLFALANAGVYLGNIELGAPGLTPVLVGVALGLVVGKPLGVMVASWIVVRLRWAALPRGVGWREVLVVGIVAGIGFTMAIFIAELAFDDVALLGVAKVAILGATAVAGTLGLGLGAWLLGRGRAGDLSLSDSDVESSTEIWTPAVVQAYGSPTSRESRRITRRFE